MSAVVRWLLALLVCTAVGDVALFVAGIWTGDSRWVETGVIFMFVFLILCGVTAMAQDAAES